MMVQKLFRDRLRIAAEETDDGRLLIATPSEPLGLHGDGGHALGVPAVSLPG
ncbi:MAG TPA: hypothetical protein VNL72_03165 [Gammaproteobacteria bacterium]|nr:hypothetical protein [Gammaproteobacteria bacterium]